MPDVFRKSWKPRRPARTRARRWGSTGTAPPTTTHDLTDPAVYGSYVRMEGFAAADLTNHAGVNPSWGSNWPDAGVRFVADVTQVELYTYCNGGKVRLATDGVAAGTAVTLPNTSSWGWVTIAAGLSGSHTYLITGGSNLFATQLRTTGAGVSTAHLKVRDVLAGYGDSITAGQATGGTDSTESWLYKAGLLLDMQPWNRGIGSTYVVGSGSNGETRTSDITGLLPAARAVVVLYGTNDAGAGTDQTTFGTSYLTMLRKLQAGCPGAKIVNERLLKVGSSDTTRDAYSSTVSTQVTALGDTDVTYASGMYIAYSGSTGIHPNGTDCDAIAAAVVADVRAVLAGGGGGSTILIKRGGLSCHL